jgi:hypothetical protein
VSVWRRALLAVLGGVAAGACGEAVSPEPLGDYQSWTRIDTWGLAPGHGDSYRIIYANDDARRGRGGRFPEGAVLVKEIRDLSFDDAGAPAPGGLRYVAIMRRLGPPSAEPEVDGGWLFTRSQTPGGAEQHDDFCWARCHVAAPFAGAWLDYALAE